MKRALILSGGGARGAFQVGVWKCLRERGWDPDLICGTSVGAINAVAIGSGMSAETLAQIWKTHHRTQMYRLELLKFLARLLSGRTPEPLLDTGPLRSVLNRHLNIAALRRSRREIIISAVNVLTSQVRFFNQDEIGIEHVLASSAMPILFPWQVIEGQPYWDGGVMANTPLSEALERGAQEIVVVLLSPVGHVRQSQPATVSASAERVFEQFLLSSFHSTLKSREGRQQHPETANAQTAAAPVRIATVAPSRMLGFRSLLNFSIPQAHRLIAEGYRNARLQLPAWCAR